MKFNRLSLKTKTIIALSLIGCGLGLLFGDYFVGEYDPPWDHSSISFPSDTAVEIAHVDFFSTLEDPTGDILFVATENGEIYTNTLYESDWQLSKADPNWTDENISKCANEWIGSTIYGHMGDHPPVDKVIVDSAGVRYERPLSIIVRCYLLLEDGSLQVWVHSGNAMDSMAGLVWKIGLIVLGGGIGAVAGVVRSHYSRDG